MKWAIYQNNHNSNKFVEVRYYDCGHQTIVQFQMTNSGKRNYNGFSKPYRMRVKKSSLNYLLENAYTLIEEDRA